MSGIYVAGTGMYVPPMVVTNDDLAKLVDTSDEWITERTGIRQRRFSQGAPTWVLGREAALQAIENAGIEAGEIDMIIACSVTSDYCTPSLACMLQREIGAESAACWDMNAACSGFIFALDAAYRYLATGGASTILIVCSEVLSRITDFEDRSTCVLFGDGAGAVVVKKDEGRLFESCVRSQGKSGGALFARSGKFTSPFVKKEEIEKYDLFRENPGCHLVMEGREVYRFAVAAMPEMINNVCEKAGIPCGDLDWVIPHQANIRIIKTAAERLHIGMEKMVINLDRYGNTSCASIPMCLDELNRSGRLKRGARIALAGFGAGLTCGAIVLEW
ncbi:MAG: ketoacyl-ACP synthase III [Clostridia bacterium]|nr:ketoacyl-ACP synthase III [Clostridia bacterium]MDR3645791.1 ketoacyl-ACP synthase III [Clostridia bacterium]